LASCNDGRAATVIEDPRLSCVYYTGWTGVACGLGMRERPGISIGTVPTGEDTTLVLTYFPQERFHAVRTDPLHAHLDGVQATLETARLRVQASRLRMLRSVARLPAARERYFALVAGIISMDEFLTPELALSLCR
jgi:hypothetical protein